ncbi:hypothetical protein K504DRAFT_383196, partial [Pleomassaria siparia CBS 279.74]
QQSAIRGNGSGTAIEDSKTNKTLLKYFGGLVDKRSQKPKADLISKLVTAQVLPGNIDRADAVQISFWMLVAGNITMVSLISFGAM